MSRISEDTWSRQIHAELRAMAHRLMRGERRDHTLQPTALVHEAWLRLASRDDARALPRERFLALAATTMRRVLVDGARRRRSTRRGADRRAGSDGLELAESESAPTPSDSEVLDLDVALEALAHADPELARLVELRVFGGHGVEETARILGISERTVKRRWRFARGWLAREIEERAK